MRFDDALPRLIHLYEKGLLVPFIGAGMSMGACEGWEALVAKLEKHASLSVEPSPGEKPDAASLIQRANRVARKLRYGGSRSFEDTLRGYLGNDNAVPHSPPAQTQALAAIWWPLVLTTNYDNCFYACVRHSGTRVRGRSPVDCQKVLTSLTAPSAPIIWALQGYLATPCDTHAEDEPYRARLATEVVFGHEEYRRVTHKEPHFRRAFSEVYRSRSLLFLGCGLRDPYLLELFGEVLENLGPNPFPHYAFAKEGEVDSDFLRTRLNTVVIPYANHSELPELLKALHRGLTAPRVRQMRWTWSMTCGAKLDEDSVGKESLEIVRGELPLPGPGECVALSVGRAPQDLPFLGDMAAYISEVCRGKAPPALDREGYVTRAGSGPLFFVAPRPVRADKRDLRFVPNAMGELLSAAEAAGFKRVRMQLIASGRFPPRFSLAKMVRAFARWWASRASDLKVSIHVVDPNVLFNLSTGRLDISELLSAGDLRFWVQTVTGESASERQLYFASYETPLGELIHELDIPLSWSMKVSPAPRADDGGERIAELTALSLEELGVVPGATLRFKAPQVQDEGRSGPVKPRP